MIRSPPASSLPAGALPSPYPATRPSAKAIQPRSITRSARTILALPMTVSDLVEVISVVFLHAAAANDVTSTTPIGDQMTDFIVMDNGDDSNTRALFFIGQIDHDSTVDGIKGRVTRLIRSSYALHEAVAAA